MKFIETIHAEGGEVYEVGGTLRDALLGLKVKDHDLLVTGLPLDKLTPLLSKLGRVQQVGKSFGVLKFKPRVSSMEYDIALPRKERSTGQGHRDFEVEFDSSLSVEEDLARRDFTINAMARHLKTAKLIDPHQGLTDLQNKILRQVFEKTFEEDPLRLLRGIQFAARFELTVEPRTLKGMQENAHLLSTVSPERIIQELEKLFLASQPSIGFRLLQEVKILHTLFPWLKEQNYQKLLTHLDATMDLSLSQKDRLTLFFSLLFLDCPPQEALAWMTQYKIAMLNLQAQDLLHFIHFSQKTPSQSASAFELRRFLHEIHPQGMNLILELARIQAKVQNNLDTLQSLIILNQRLKEVLSECPPLFLKDLALDGNDLMKMGFEKGPKLGKILKSLLDYVLEDPKRNTKEALADYLKSRDSNPTSTSP